MAKKHGPNKENLEATRRLFLQIARKDFSKLGYYNASTAQIVEASGMARGSLYYHFGDKKGLFRAVYEELMYEMCENTLTHIQTMQDPWDRFIAACMNGLDLLMQAETRRIIIDVHTALTYAERLEILQRTLIKHLVILMDSVIAAGYFKGHDSRTLVTLIFGILSEGGRMFELAGDVPKARATIGDAFVRLMEAARG